MRESFLREAFLNNKRQNVDMSGNSKNECVQLNFALSVRKFINVVDFGLETFAVRAFASWSKIQHFDVLSDLVLY